MIRTLEAVGMGYSKQIATFDRIAHRIEKNHGDSEVAHDIVALTVTQRSAEACLEVLKVADSLSESLIHIVA